MGIEKFLFVQEKYLLKKLYLNARSTTSSYEKCNSRFESEEKIKVGNAASNISSSILAMRLKL